ncbi:MAG: hypothetical protein FD174_589 [Geobacteraceae bacterium]|nr:MAG: hypothetical protein FD174_589 [Geobacteraceae bacterium]
MALFLLFIDTEQRIRGQQHLCKVCDHYFGQARQSSGSHRVYRTPWIGDPRVNIQNDRGQAKAYQVKQVLKAIERLELEHAQKNDKYTIELRGLKKMRSMWAFALEKLDKELLVTYDLPYD